MQILRYQGRDLRDALQRARRAHGDEALVLSHESTPDGGVTVAVARGRRAPAAAADGDVPRAGAAASSLREPGLAEVEERLQRHGASRALVRAVVGRVSDAGARGIYALDAAAEHLERAFRVAPSPRPGSAPLCFAFTGPAGAGKTLALAKLAGRLQAAGRGVVPVTLDATRAGAAALRAALEPFGLTPRTASDARDLLDLVRRAQRGALTLVDTAGRPGRGHGPLRELARAGADVHPWLVASASQTASETVAWLDAYRGPEPTAALVTGVDRTDRPAAVVEALARRSFEFGFLGTGADPRRGLVRAAPAHFADLFLRGRLARPARGAAPAREPRRATFEEAQA